MSGERPPEQELFMYLELDQLVAETLRPLPRAHLGARAVLALWALRVAVLIVSAMVIYVFATHL
jgi:hypothetical protein